MSTTVITTETKTTPIIYKVIVVLGMVSLMGGTITATMTYLNNGFNDEFFRNWISNFVTALSSVIPTGLAIMVMLTKAANKWLIHIPKKARDMLVGVTMALIMESGMALTSTYNHIGFTDSALFAQTWFSNVLGALPVALALMITISLTIKPKVEAFVKS